MPDTPGSRIVGPKARRKRWSVQRSSGYLASRPFRTLNPSTRHARERAVSCEGTTHSFDLHVSGVRVGRIAGSVKQVPRLRARTGHAPCRQAAAFALSLLYPRTLASLSLGQTRGCRIAYVSRRPSISSPQPVTADVFSGKNNSSPRPPAALHR